MASSCDDAFVSRCVSSRPSLGLAALQNLFGAVLGLWFLYTSYHGLLQLSRSNGILKLLSAFWDGLTAFFGTVFSRGREVSNVARSSFADFSGTTQRVIYFLALAITVAVGILTMDSPSFGIAIVVIASFAAIGAVATGRISNALVAPIGGGIAAGLLITVVVALARFFRVSKNNVFGDVMAIFLVMYFLFGLMVVYGGRATRREDKSSSSSQGQWIANQSPGYYMVPYQPPPAEDGRRKK